MDKDKLETGSSPSWEFRDYQEALAVLAFSGVIIFHLIRLPFRSVQGVRVEFEQSYRCVNMRGRVYYLDPTVARWVLEDKRAASLAPCRINDGGWFGFARCETHHLEEVPALFEGRLGGIFNY